MKKIRKRIRKSSAPSLFHSSKSSTPEAGAVVLNDPNAAGLLALAALWLLPQSPAVAFSFSRSLMDLPAPATVVAVFVEPRDKLQRSSKLEELLTAGAVGRLSLLEFIGAVGADIVKPIAIGVGLKGAEVLPNKFNGG